jgi:hypothetical protein
MDAIQKKKKNEKRVCLLRAVYIYDMNKVTCTMRLLGGNDRKASSFSIAM